jgi:hypothetical protein
MDVEATRCGVVVGTTRERLEHLISGRHGNLSTWSVGAGRDTGSGCLDASQPLPKAARTLPGADGNIGCRRLVEESIDALPLLLALLRLLRLALLLPVSLLDPGRRVEDDDPGYEGGETRQGAEEG